MKKGMLGRKVGMTQVFDEKGFVIPVTVVKAGPLTVVQKKTLDTDGYNSIKVGFEDAKERRLNKPDKGQFAKANVSVKRQLKEFRLDDTDKYEVGQEIKVGDMFKVGDKIDVSGISKGKGYQGVTKRYGLGRGRMTHGSKYHRGVGALGAGTSPGKIFKGRKLPGHMGVDKVTVQNLDVVIVDSEKNLLAIKGAIPGPKGGLVVIKNSVKLTK